MTIGDKGEEGVQKLLPYSLQTHIFTLLCKTFAYPTTAVGVGSAEKKPLKQGQKLRTDQNNDHILA